MNLPGLGGCSGQGHWSLRYHGDARVAALLGSRPQPPVSPELAPYPTPEPMPHLEPITPGFSTADAEYPNITAKNGVLTLTFRNWKTQEIEVCFSEVCAFRWQEAELLLPGEPHDGAVEVLNSEWLALHISQGAIPEEQAAHHYRFNFNACGQFEVLCGSFTVAGEPSPLGTLSASTQGPQATRRASKP